MARRMFTALCFALGTAAVLGAGAYVYMSQPKFGAAPDAISRALTEASPNFRDGSFQNVEPTQALADGQDTFRIVVKNLFNSPAGSIRPETPLSVIKTDFRSLSANEDALVWLGHGSFYLVLDGVRLLVDPVLSDYGAPVSFFNRAFDGTTPWTASDIPAPDWLVITHDHWDHLDFDTVRDWKDAQTQVLVPLGVGSLFRSWGFPAERVHETDWYQTTEAGQGLRLTSVPARHFSGRSFKRNGTQWCGFVIEGQCMKLYLSGDTGYGKHFREIAGRFGPFDLVALDCGQYDPRWPLIHMRPEEAVRAARELGAKRFMPAHIGRFALAVHPWHEPFERAEKAAADIGLPLLTPEIGQVVKLRDL